MIVLSSIPDVRAFVREQRGRGRTIGFVPTMGALHDGHASLVRRAATECDTVMTSIYVNPTQFSANEDLDAYPRTFDADQAIVLAAGGHAIFAPSDTIMYPGGRENWKSWVSVEHLTRHLCGASRPHHFRGVTTIVTKLFNIVQPDRAYFGQKDFQQCRVLQRMVKDLDMPIDVVMCPIVREPDGLAMSSRNAYLSKQEREQALSLHQSLELACEAFRDGIRDVERLKERIRNRLAQASFARIDYVEIVDGNSLEPVALAKDDSVVAVAVYFGATRLIDNAVFDVGMTPH